MSINLCNDRSMASITSLPSGVSGSSLVLISTLTADGSGTTITFDSDIDSTYSEYIFKYINVHPATNGAGLFVNFRDGSTAYDATKTTTFFVAEQRESDSTGFTYDTGSDLAQSTSAQKLTGNIGNDNDQSSAGTLHLFNPSSTTFVKHFIGVGHEYQEADYANVNYVAGYCNVTAAIDGVQFSMSSGNMDSGTFKMYGVV